MSSVDIGNIVCAVVIGVSVLVLAYAVYKIYQIHKEVKEGANSSAKGPESDETTKRNWKIEYSDLEIGPLIGQGSMGRVFKGKWRGLTVAVKVSLLTHYHDHTLFMWIGYGECV